MPIDTRQMAPNPTEQAVLQAHRTIFDRLLVREPEEGRSMRGIDTTLMGPGPDGTWLIYELAPYAATLSVFAEPISHLADRIYRWGSIVADAMPTAYVCVEHGDLDGPSRIRRYDMRLSTWSRDQNTRNEETLASTLPALRLMLAMTTLADELSRELRTPMRCELGDHIYLPR